MTSMEQIVRPFQRPVQGRLPHRPAPVQPAEETAILEWGAKMGDAVVPNRSYRMEVKFLECEDLENWFGGNSMVAQMLASSLLHDCEEEPIIEMDREVHEKRVENEADPNQFVDVEVIDAINFKLPKLLQGILRVKKSRYELKNDEEEA